MKNPGSGNTSQHPKESLLPYLEDMLSHEDRSTVEAHLQDCPDCSNELKEIGETTTFLRTHKEIFCPELWELYDYCQTGTDPDGRLAKHLEECPWCREAVAGCAGCTQDTEMPRTLRDAVEGHYGTKPLSAAVRVAENWFAAIARQVSSLFRMPVLALGTVAAAVLIVVVFYPSPDSRPIMRLSSLQWDVGDPAMTSKAFRLMTPTIQREVPVRKRQRVAALLFLKGFDKGTSQEQVDALYSALKPTRLIQQRFEFMAPAAVRGTVGDADLKPGDAAQLSGKLGKELGVSKVIILTVAKNGNDYEVKSELRTPQTGKIVAEKAERGVSEADLALKLKETTLAVLSAESTD